MNSIRTILPRLKLSSRSIHTRVGLPYPIETGLNPFLSSNALKTIAVDWQDGILARLNTLVKGTELESLSVVQTLVQTAQDPNKSLTFNYASEALNNSFFLSTLSTTASLPTPTSLFSSKLSNSTLNSLPGLISTFSAHVAGLHPSSGAYVWLVTDEKGNLGIVGTYAGGSLLVQNRIQRKPLMTAGGILGEVIQPTTASISTPSNNTRGFSTSAITPALAPKTSSFSSILSPATTFGGGPMDSTVGKQLHPLLCLSLHPHCYLQDYGIWGREEYLKNWWGFVDWQGVEKSFGEIIKAAAAK